jgi:hypothetical protein
LVKVGAIMVAALLACQATQGLLMPRCVSPLYYPVYYR